MATETQAREMSLKCDVTLSLNADPSVAPVKLGEGPLSAPIGLYNVFDGSPADWTAGVGHLFEAEAAGVAETHVSAGVDDGVHCVFVADRALVRPRARGGWERG